jgi:hypothetical protein
VRVPASRAKEGEGEEGAGEEGAGEEGRGERGGQGADVAGDSKAQKKEGAEEQALEGKRLNERLAQAEMKNAAPPTLNTTEDVMLRMNEFRANVEEGKLDADIRIARKQQELNKIKLGEYVAVSREYPTCIVVGSRLILTHLFFTFDPDTPLEVFEHILSISMNTSRTIQKYHPQPIFFFLDKVSLIINKV